MSLFARSFYNDSTSFTPLFRLLEDFDNYRQGGEQHNAGGRSGGDFWQPKFDVRETAENYELHGELPGMSKDNVHLEFTEPQTLLVRGRSERSYTSGTPAAGLLHGSSKKGQITEDGETASQKATVEDENEDHKTNPAASDFGKEVEKAEKSRSNHDVKYWLSERSVGEFSRSFNFPAPVAQDSVSASFKDGVLNVTVPKSKKQGARRIAID